MENEVVQQGHGQELCLHLYLLGQLQVLSAGLGFLYFGYSGEGGGVVRFSRIVIF